MKKIVIGLMLIVTCFLISGCGKKETVVEERNLVGGWDIDVPIKQLALPDKAQEVFDSATSNYTKMKLTPISLLGTQVVSGTNYMYLCKGEKDSSTKWVIVTIYIDTSNNTEITNVKYFNLNDYVNINSELKTTQTLGGWSVYKNTEAKLDEEVQDIFTKAVKDNEKISYKPIALLGEQIGAGVNYAILALGENKEEEKIYSINLLTINNKLDGTATLISSAYIPLAKYSK